LRQLHERWRLLRRDQATLERGEGVLLVDVREPWEFEICRIEGAKLIPMGTVPANLQALDTDDDEVICYVTTGMRSMDVRCGARSSVESAKSMSGGIDRWSAEIDPKFLGIARFGGADVLGGTCTNNESCEH